MMNAPDAGNKRPMAGDPGPCIRVPLRCGWGIAFLALMTVAPLAWMISTAFKRASEQFSTRLVPAHPTFGNFVAVFTQFPLLRYSLAAADRASASTSIAAPIATLSTLGSTVTRRGQPGLVPKVLFRRTRAADLVDQARARAMTDGEIA